RRLSFVEGAEPGPRPRAYGSSATKGTPPPGPGSVRPFQEGADPPDREDAFVTEHQLFLFLAEVVVLVVAARLGGELALRLGIAQVVGELVVGILLGPSLFGKLWPGGFGALFPSDPAQRSFLELMGWIGVIFLVLLSGFETRL